MVVREEIEKSIRSFVNDAKENEIIESVYYTSWVEGCRTVIQVTAVRNDAIAYKEKIDRTFGINDRENITRLVQRYNSESVSAITGPSLEFKEADAGNYCIMLMHSREIAAVRDLVSGHILFDRFDRFTRLQQELASNFIAKPFANLTDIPFSSDFPSLNKMKNLV